MKPSPDIRRSFRFTLLFGSLVLLLSISAISQPTPKDVLGFTPGDDYKLAHWAKIVEYFQKLDAASDRVVFKEIGKTTLGKPFTYALISSPSNLNRLDYYRAINDKLADPRKINRSEKEAAKLIKKGKTFVLITHGIHSTEVGSTLSSTLIAHHLATSNDKRISKILDNTIIIIVPSLNPDGVDIVKDWYDKTLGTKFEGTSPPELYHKYVGHDNNRDWYAFTQVETQLTVERIHNVYHPQIVHDIHQQGTNGARYFVPPYLDPVEPNVPPEIIEGYTEIGNYIAAAMRKDGKQGITTASTYDAWTPARAYSHYHGGARILSETASARLASPIEIDFGNMRGSRGFDAKVESDNYGPLWKGGKWGLGDITKYMTDGAFHLLDHASENRKKWLTRFHKIGYDATKPKKEGEVTGLTVSSDRVLRLLDVGRRLETGGVSYQLLEKTNRDWRLYVTAGQPNFGFAKAMLLNQEYPNLIDSSGIPIPPYDVTAHSLALLSGVSVEEVTTNKRLSFVESYGPLLGSPVAPCKEKHEYRIFKSHSASMDEGWTRWVFAKYSDLIPVPDNEGCTERKNSVSSLSPNDVRNGIPYGVRSIVFPDQSPNQVMNGYAKDAMPDEYVGGVGTEGVASLKKYVEEGGTLVFMNRSSDFAIEKFNLPVVNIAKDWEQKDFFIPGSILRTELDISHAIGQGMKKESIAWFERSPVFELNGTSNDNMFARIIAKYPDKPEDILLSGWALGKKKIAGKAALVEVRLGRGKIVLFGFRPQYRGQSIATFPLLFNAISY